MVRFILVTFLFLGWAFYVASGGSDFTAQLQERRELAAATAQAKEEAKALRAQELAQSQPTPRPVSDAMVTRAGFTPTPVTPAPVSNSASQKPATPAQTAPKILTIEAAPLPDIREVSGSRVNVRMGPSTSYNIVLRLTQGTRVRVLQEPGNGWIKLKVEETGRIGWIAARLLAKTNS